MHILGTMHVFSRIQMLGEPLRHTINVLASLAPDWLRTYVPADWHERYVERPSEYRLPKAETQRLAWAEQIGTDGTRLLTTLDADAVAPDLRTLPAVEILGQV